MTMHAFTVLASITVSCFMLATAAVIAYTVHCCKCNAKKLEIAGRNDAYHAHMFLLGRALALQAVKLHKEGAPSFMFLADLDRTGEVDDKNLHLLEMASPVIDTGFFIAAANPCVPGFALVFAQRKDKLSLTPLQKMYGKEDGAWDSWVREREKKYHESQS